jgi:hypothetical protein
MFHEKHAVTLNSSCACLHNSNLCLPLHRLHIFLFSRVYMGLKQSRSRSFLLFDDVYKYVKGASCIFLALIKMRIYLRRFCKPLKYWKNIWGGGSVPLFILYTIPRDISGLWLCLQFSPPCLPQEYVILIRWCRNNFNNLPSSYIYFPKKYRSLRMLFVPGWLGLKCMYLIWFGFVEAFLVSRFFVYHHRESIPRLLPVWYLHTRLCVFSVM